MHGELVEADDDVGPDGILDQALLAAVPLNREGILRVVFTGQPAGRQVGDGGRGATHEQPGKQEQREDFFHIEHSEAERYTSVGGL